MTEQHGSPYFEVPAKRSLDKVPIDFDWHDYVANLWVPGTRYNSLACIRPERALATGFAYQAINAGTTGDRRPVWPTTLGAVVRSGSITFQTIALNLDSIRANIVFSEYTATGLLLSDASVNDQVHRTYVAGGANGGVYEVRNKITLANDEAEVKEAVAVVRVLD